MKFTLVVLGSLFIGFILPEVLVAFGKVRVPTEMNVVSAIGCAMIAAGIML